MKQHSKIHDREEWMKQECLKEKNRQYLAEINEHDIVSSVDVETIENCEVVCIVPGDLVSGDLIIGHYEVIAEKTSSDIEIEINDKTFEPEKGFINLNSESVIPNISVEHVEDVFPREDSRVCEFCQKNFKKPADLERHRRTHTKEKPYQVNARSVMQGRSL